jgi:general nucleoside transport system permease protein
VSVGASASVRTRGVLSRFGREVAPRWGYPLFAVALALLVSAGLLAVTGTNPVDAYRALYDGSLGSTFGLSVTLVRMTPLLLAGLGVAISFRAGVFNIGAEGQLYAGAIAATATALYLPGLPPVVLPIACMLAGLAGGAVWVAIPAWLRAYRGVSEVVVTLMFNFIGIYFASYLVNLDYGPLGLAGSAYPQSDVIPTRAELPIIWPTTSVHAGLLIGVFLALVLFVVIRYTPFGFRLRAVGSNPEAAQYAGIPVKRMMVAVMLISGGLAGLAGASEILGLKYALYANFSPGYGYDAIAVALLARNSPIAAIVSAAFFGAMRAGAVQMEQTVGVESSFVLIIEALAILFLAIGVFVQRRRSGPDDAVTETVAAKAPADTTSAAPDVETA